MKRKWALLTGAIIAEVAGTLMLRATIENPLWIPLVVISYALAFTLLGLTLRLGLPIGVVYGTWAAFGVALVAVLGMVVFGDTLSIGAMIGIAIIIVGVVLIETSTKEKPLEADDEVTA
ncbi:DMT family transporter [Brevibacterium aurantiacum]|uniref:DMT family transporter n=1 Tax=Brevibacterium aurantiacum TaxID=273384 RepID=UPI000F651E3B|nr:SMR family transporter [Brevibacterium aurantiacum]AZL08305.1 QacE family quaternary ammonium compound efflux SMR transporter [Brevibacterium aurantiacum]